MCRGVQQQAGSCSYARFDKNEELLAGIGSILLFSAKYPLCFCVAIHQLQLKREMNFTNFTSFHIELKFCHLWASIKVKSHVWCKQLTIYRTWTKRPGSKTEMF